MRRSVPRLLALAVLLVVSTTTRAQYPPPVLTASQMAAGDLGRRLDDLQDLLSDVGLPMCVGAPSAASSTPFASILRHAR